MNRETAYTLREASEEDFLWLRQLHHATMRDTVERIWGWDPVWQDAYYREHFDARRLRVIQIAGRDIGMLEVEERPDEIFLANIQINPRSKEGALGQQCCSICNDAR